MIMMEVPENQNNQAEDLIKIIEDSIAHLCELLKRSDENAVVVHAHKHPMFVEDCVRNMVQKIVLNIQIFPDDAW